ncbi:hypothetical protein CLOM_g18198, partial [Closterium sp. NIES-68]
MSSGGERKRLWSNNSCRVVMHAHATSQTRKSLVVCFNHWRFQTNLGRVSHWISSQTSQKHGRSYCDLGLCGSIDQNGALRCYYNRRICGRYGQVVCSTRVPLTQVLVSDRDPRFTSRFWHEVTRTLGTKLKMSSAFHPQTDGQTERTNRTLEQMLRSFIGPTQDDWDDLLPVVEFAVNNSVHEGTHEKPFILNCGRHPTTPATHGIGGLRVPAAKDFVGKQQEALKSARRWLQLSQQRQKSYADMKRREVSFEVGDKVLLSTKNIRLKIPGARKLFPRWIGPFEVIQRVGVVAYKLPETLQIHN